MEKVRKLGRARRVGKLAGGERRHPGTSGDVPVANQLNNCGRRLR